MVSASSATDPEISTITSWAIEVAPSASRLIFTARIPAALDSNDTVDAVGGVMAMWRKHFPQRGTDLAAASAVAVSVTMSVACAVVVSVVCGVRVGFVGHARRPFGRAGSTRR